MKFLITVFFLLVLHFCSAQNDYKDLDNVIEKDNSENILSEIASHETSYFLDYLEMGLLCFEDGQLDYASEYIGLAIKKFGGSPMNYEDTSFVNTKDRLYRVSIKIFDELLKDEPSSINYGRRACLKSDLGILKEAVKDNSAALRMDSLNHINYYNRGNTYRKMLLLDSALLDYSKAIELYPQFSHAYCNKGFTYLLLDEFELALVQFESAFQFSKNVKSTSQYLNNIGYTYYKLKNYNFALQFINESIRINAINSYAYKNLALVEIALGKDKSACKNIKKSIELGFVQQHGNEILEIQKQHCGSTRE